MSSGDAYTVYKPSGLHIVHSRSQVSESGHLVVAMPAQDYVPPQEESLVLWTDFGDQNSSSTRAGAIQFSQRNALFATGSGSLQASTCVVDGSAAFALGKQGGRGILSMARSSTGVEGHWGPLPSTWTFSAYVRLANPVTAFGNYNGVGPITMMSSAAVGVTLSVPSGGSIPSSNVASTGGPIDGVLAGWPWDAALVNQWRLLTVVNDAAIGTRTTYVDGCAVGSGPASTTTIPSNTTLFLFPSSSVSIAEFSVWSTASMTSTQLLSLVTALRTKWGVTALPTPAASATLSTVSFGPTASVPANAYLPTDVPAPRCWLDAGAASTVRADAAGQTAAGPYQNVRQLRDRGTLGCHCTFAAGDAVWGTGPVDKVQTWPVLLLSGMGTFAQSPLQGLSSSSGYTIVACFRYIDGAHPLAMSVNAVIGPSVWKEYIGTSMIRNMPTTQIASRDMVTLCWHFNNSGNVLTAMLNTTSYPAGYMWTRVETTGWSPVVAPRLGNTGKSLHLCELLVWHSRTGPCTRCVHASGVAYQPARWGHFPGTCRHGGEWGYRSPQLPVRYRITPRWVQCCCSRSMPQRRPKQCSRMLRVSSP